MPVPNFAAQQALRPALDAGLETLSLDLPSSARERLLHHLELTARWNRVYNLTAVREPSAMLVQHLLDSLAVVGPLRRQLGGARPARILDVGSGAGFPGVVLAVAEPAWSVTCVDAVGKKASFVQQVAAELKLPNLRSEHGRVEQLTLPPFDVIASRAFASLPDFVTWTRPLCGARGIWMALKGKHPADELRALPPDIEVFHVEPLAVPGLNAERCVVWMRDKEGAR